MTIEEIIHKEFECDYDDSPSLRDGLDAHIENLMESIKSRTCENCMHYIKDIHMCDHSESFAKQYKATVLDTDGCNKFERKKMNKLAMRGKL